MTTRITTFTVAFLLMSCTTHAGIMLFDDPGGAIGGMAFNVDGNINELLPGDAPPNGVDFSDFDSTSGLGTVKVVVSGAGSHSVAAFFDHEIDAIANSFFDEFGEAIGTPNANQSWEVDEPGFLFGDIFSNFAGGSLDNSNAIELQFLPQGDDVSMAMGWDFHLASDETAVVSFLLAESAPSSGFYLAHRDLVSSEAVFFSSSLEISSMPSFVVPEPGAAVIWIAAGLITGIRRRRQRHPTR